VRVQFPAWSAAEEIAAEQLGPALDRLDTEGAAAERWFLRKHPVAGKPQARGSTFLSDLERARRFVIIGHQLIRLWTGRATGTASEPPEER